MRNYARAFDGEMVATASVAVADGVAGIYNVATLEHARCKGFGVYACLVFRECGDIEHFTWPQYV